MIHGKGEIIVANLPTHTYRHNDLPFLIRVYYENQFDKLDLTVNSSAHPPGPSWHTDIPRLRAGKVGGQVIDIIICLLKLCIEWVHLMSTATV